MKVFGNIYIFGIFLLLIIYNVREKPILDVQKYAADK